MAIPAVTPSAPTSPVTSSSAPAASAATMAAEGTDGPVVSVVSKRLRALRKKEKRINQMEESLAAGKTLNPKQVEVLLSKPLVAAQIEELDYLCPRLASALKEELSYPALKEELSYPAPADSDSSVHDILALLYFGSMYDVVKESDFVSWASTRKLERNRCLGDDPEGSLVETDLNAVAALASLVASRSPATTAVSHRDALQACARHARLWLCRADEPIHTDSSITYASVREKLDLIRASGYNTAEVPLVDLAAPVASVGAGGVQLQDSKSEAPGVVEGCPTFEELKDSMKRLFLSNDSDIRETFKDYIHPNGAPPPVVKINVAGDDRTCLKRSPRSMRGTAAYINWHLDLNDEGYVVVGEISLQDFVVDYSGILKGRRTLLQKITKHITAKKVSTGLFNAAVLIEEAIYCSLPIPDDLHHLLKLLKNYTIGLSPLVRGHASHSEGAGQKLLYDNLYRRLKVLAQFKPALCKRILKVLTERLPEVNGWLEKASMNFHLLCVLRYQIGTSNNLQMTLESVLTGLMCTRIQYAGNLKGLMDIRRNSDAHLEEDYSVDRVGKLEAGLYGVLVAFKIFYQKALQKLQVEHNMQRQDLHKKHAKDLEDEKKRQEDERQRMPQRHQKILQKLADAHQLKRQEREVQLRSRRWQDLRHELDQFDKRHEQHLQNVKQRLDRLLQREEERLQRKHPKELEKLLRKQKLALKQQERRELLDRQEKLLEELPQTDALLLVAALTRFLSDNQQQHLSVNQAKAGVVAIVNHLADHVPHADERTLVEAITKGVFFFFFFFGLKKLALFIH